MKLESKPIVHVSNRLDCLRRQIARALFYSETGSFQKKIIILPDLKGKDLLMQEFLKETEIILGLDFMDLNSALNFLTRTLASRTLNLPSLDLLALHIFPFIEKSCTEKNRCSLAKTLASEFLNYSHFGNGELVKWKSREGGQQAIWNDLFSRWDTPDKLLELELSKSQEPLEIHLYGFPFLPDLYHHFFEKVAAHHPVHYYQFSPCMSFWTDIFSEKERLYLEKKVAPKVQEEWSSYLKNRPLLLAQLGSLSKGTFCFFEEADFPLVEHYVSPRGSTMLQKIQKQILGYEKKPKFGKDNSITLNVATSKRREVEVLYETLLSLDVRPSEVKVYAPDISAYAPLISLIFEVQNSPFPLSISDLSKEEVNPLIQSFVQLLDLNQDRFSLEAVLRLFESAPFRRKFCLKKGEVESFKRWMEEGKVKWGIDLTHRQKLLSGKKIEGNGESGTFEKRFQSILTGFVKLAKKAPSWKSPLLDFSDAHTFGKAVFALRSLQERLEFLETATLSLDKWSEHLLSLLRDHFMPESEELAIFGWIEEKIKSLGRAPLPDHLYRFYPIYTYLKSLFQKKTERIKRGYTSEWVEFSSLKLGSVVSAPVICLLGLDESQFPRSQTKSPLQELDLQKRIFAQQEDRHLFLEAIFGASERLILSYVSISEEDGKEQFVSSILQELLNFLSPVSITKHHPPFSFHQDYFKAPNQMSESAFLMAKSYYFPESDCAPLIPEFLHRREFPQGRTQNLELSLSDLTLFARHPLRFYLNRTLRLTLHYENADEEFSLSHLNQSLLKKRAYALTFDEAFEELEECSLLPVGRFGEVAKCCAFEEVKKLKKFAPSRSEPLLLEIKLGCEGHRLARIRGSLFDITEEGMLFYGEKSLRDLLKIWPLYLSYACQTEGNSLLFTQTGEHLTCQDPKSSLLAYLLYFEKAQEIPSPFLPKWAPIFLEKEASALAKTIHNEKDPYVQSIFKSRPYNVEVIFDTWAPFLKETFKPLIEFLL